MKIRALILFLILLIALASASDVNQLQSMHPELSREASTV